MFTNRNKIIHKQTAGVKDGTHVDICQGKRWHICGHMSR